MKIYAVTQGIYSGYHIISLTTDKLVAESLARRFSRKFDDTNVEEYEDGSFLMAGSIYRVWSFGTNMQGCELDESEYNIPNIGIVNHVSGNKELYTTYIIAGSNEQALKIGKDRIMRYIAEQEGIL